MLLLELKTNALSSTLPYQSTDDQANIDVPKIFDYILEKTNKEKLSVVGHSMGGAMVLMALIDNPELSNKS